MKRNVLSLFSRLSVSALVMAPMLLMAQEESGADGDQSFLGSFIEATTIPFFILLTLLMLAMLGVVVYNLVLLIPKGRFVPAELYSQLHELMSACQVRSAIEASSADSSYLGRMMAEALPKVDATDPETLGQEGVEDAMADFSFRENRPYQAWLSWISMIGQIAPMVGLLGTVMGMIGAFSSLASSSDVDPAVLANDINTALYTTAWGLVIAIPSLIAFTTCKNLLNHRVNESLKAGSELMDASIIAVNADNLLAKVPEGLEG